MSAKRPRPASRQRSVVRQKAVNGRAESSRRGAGERDGSYRERERSRSPRSPPTLDVGRDRGHFSERFRRRRPRVPTLGSREVEDGPIGGVRRRGPRRARCERVRVAHGHSTAAAKEGDDRSVSPLDVHGGGPSWGGPCDPDCARSDPVEPRPGNRRAALARLAVRRTRVHATRLRAHRRDAPGSAPGCASSRSDLAAKVTACVAVIPSEGARKPSYMTLIYEARTRRVSTMTTAYDVPPSLLIERLKDHLQKEGKIKPPAWAAFARTGVHTEKAPVQSDWWYRRVAAVLRKLYLHGPVGTSRLAAEFGGRRDDGSAPYHPRRGSRSIAREAMQQLESLGLLAKIEKKGRVISAQGRKLVDSMSHEILMELAKTNPELTKYAGGRLDH